MKWAYGVTTIPERREDVLPRTLKSLAAAGFDAPRLFVDGELDPAWWQSKFHLEVTARWPRVRTLRNWWLSLQELWVREPSADRYAIFQDDLTCVGNLRRYLDKATSAPNAYFNLYTFRDNEEWIARDRSAVGWHQACPVNETDKEKWRRGEPLDKNCWQSGRGALALVFSRSAMEALLTSRFMMMRPTDVTEKGWRNVDGAVVTAMNQDGFREMVHSPSLVQHTGDLSYTRGLPHKKADTFPGERFDAAAWLERPVPVA